MIKVAIIGYGYWGPNLLRNFMSAKDCSVTHVCDLNSGRRKQVKNQSFTIKTTERYSELLENEEVEAVVIATPVSSHFELAKAALLANKHVLVEKPFVLDSSQGEFLIELAKEGGRVLMVDHTFLFTAAVRKIKKLIDNKELGDLYYYDSVRVNLGLFQHDINVLWDLAIHDLSILDYVFPEKPVAVSATGTCNVPGEPENLGYMTLYYESNFVAHIHVNWLAPVKIRQTLIGGSRKMVVYNDLEPSEKLKIYDKGIQFADSPEKIYQQKIGYRVGDMWAPKMGLEEGLEGVTTHFLECITHHKVPICDAQSGLRMVKILEAANQSIVERGKPVSLQLG